MSQTTETTLRAQLAEAQRELIAKEAERAGLELERNNAQRQHTMQCAINKTDSQRILELTTENELLREQRNRIGLCIDRALNGGKKDDHEAGLGGRMDAIRALVAEAQRDAERWNRAVQCARLDQFGDFVVTPDEPAFASDVSLAFIREIDAAISAAKGESND